MSAAATSQRHLGRDTPRTSAFRQPPVSEVNHHDVSTTRRGTSASIEAAEAKGSRSTDAIPDPIAGSSSRASRRRLKPSASSSSRADQHLASSTSTLAPPKVAHTKKSTALHDDNRDESASASRAPSSYAAASDSIPNATPPSPRVPYFSKYPNRAEINRLRTPDGSTPYHSDDNDTSGRSGKTRTAGSYKSGAYSDSAPSTSSRTRLRARIDADDSDPEAATFAWPAKISSSKLQHLQVPSPSRGTSDKPSSSSTSPTASPISSRTSSMYVQEEDLSTEPDASPNRSAWHDAPSSSPYGRQWRHKFPDIRDDHERARSGRDSPLQSLFHVPDNGGDASLLVPSGFDVSAMDALVDQINGGAEHSSVSDLAHLSTSKWPAPKILKKSASSTTTHSTKSSSKYPDSSAFDTHRQPTHHTHTHTRTHTRQPSSSSIRPRTSEPAPQTYTSTTNTSTYSTLR